MFTLLLYIMPLGDPLIYQYSRRVSKGKLQKYFFL